MIPNRIPDNSRSEFVQERLLIDKSLIAYFFKNDGMKDIGGKKNV